MKVQITPEDVIQHELSVLYRHATDAVVKPTKEAKIKALVLLLHSTQKCLELQGVVLDEKIEFVMKNK